MLIVATLQSGGLVWKVRCEIYISKNVYKFSHTMAFEKKIMKSDLSFGV